MKSKTAKHSNEDHCYLKGKIDKELTSLPSESITATPICSANPVSASETLVISLATPSVTPLAPTPVTPPPTYRTISPGPPAYQSIKSRDYLIINNLFIRYAPLQRIKSGLAVRPISKILSIIII